MMIKIQKIIIKKGENSFTKILQKIIIGFFLILIGIYLGKKLFGLRRKLRANELEEKFEYKPVGEKNQLFCINNKIGFF